MVVIVTYDENGGFWDHVPPPPGRAGATAGAPATRIPAIIVSPFAQARLRRPHRLRHDLDPQAHHPPLRSRAACRACARTSATSRPLST